MSEKKIIQTLAEDMALLKEAIERNRKNSIQTLTESDVDEMENSLEEYKIDEVEETEDEIDIDSDETSDNEDSEDGESEDLETDGNDTEDSDMLDIDLGDDTDSEASIDLGDDSEEIDLTGASDEEVLSVYKKMTDSDEIEVIDNGDSLELDVKTPGEYIIKDEDSMYLIL